MVVDLLDAIGQSGCGDGVPLENTVLASLLRVSACEDLPEPMRALAGRLIADHLSRSPGGDEPPLGQWLLH
jgi:hypothetical protein